MAKTSSIQRNMKRVKLAAKYAEQRKKLKAIVRSETASAAQKDNANRKLQALPRNASPVRIRNRCQLTGRARGYVRRFGLSRIAFREMALQGNIPGVRKASW
ncbi:MAG: 30S ribosomal protein S14 [Gemmatimonadales bacterium]